ncbi:peptidoglycan bridge formation glycyltransferase FemA/FemB family protein [Eubacteriales bacterium KG127]
MICEVSKENYRNFRINQGGGFFLQEEHMIAPLTKGFGSALGGEIRLLAYYKNEEALKSETPAAVGICLLRKIFGGYRLDMFSGVMSIDQASELGFYQDLKTYAKANKVIWLVIKPGVVSGVYDNSGELIERKNESFVRGLGDIGYEREVKVLSLEGNPDWQYKKNIEMSVVDRRDAFSILLKSVNNNCKRKAKKAIELGIYLENSSFEDLNVFQQITAETAERNSFVDKSLKYYEELYKSFGDRVKFVTAKINFRHSKDTISKEIDRIDEKNTKKKQRRESLIKDFQIITEMEKISGREIETIANAVMVYGDTEVIYFLGGSRTEFQALGASFLLQMTIMAQAAEKGYKTYNFFGIEGIFDGSDGVLRFKQNFNGYIEKNVGAFSCHPCNRRWKLAGTIKKFLGRGM